MAFRLVPVLERIEIQYHRRRWARRNIRMMREADGLVVSHTKSGRTWLRVMISHLYHLRYGVPAREIIKFDNFHEFNPAIPRIYFTRDTQTPTFSRSGDVVPMPPEKKVLFVVRDPRDVALSFYFHVRNRASDRELSRKGIPLEARSMDLFDFVTDEQFGIPRVIAYMNRWHREMAGFSQVRTIKFEELKGDPETALERTIAFLDRPFDEDLIRGAVAFASFENLSRKEAEGFFRTGRLQPTDATDPDTFKVRRGKAGGYRDYFGAPQIAQLDAIVRATLQPEFGYR
jgi:alcohol sulfotransferase